MHENRETPSPTVSESGSPAGEGESRTTGMHSSGESDGAVVPMKPSNKATGQAPEAAERVEGRASTKENVQQARAVPAQHGAAASQGLKGVRKVAKERKQERFTTLLHHLTVNLLRDSYYALKREAAPGVDGVRWAEYEDGLEPRLKDLHERVHRGSYRAQASRRIYMQKPDGRQRPIGIAALEDKIVQQAVVTILNAIYEEDFRGFSYGFRPGRSPHNALDALIVGIERKGVNWIVDADIRGFFDNLSHEWTMRFIQHRVADKRIHRLIQKWLKAGISEDGEWSETKVGTPQGAVVSPLLANVYLHYAFDLWLEVWRKKVAKGKVMAIRYADDLVVGFERRDEAERFLKEFGERLAKFGLELHPEKTRRIEFGPNAARDRRARREGKPESFTRLFPDPKTDGAEAIRGETADPQADAAQSHARAGTEGRGVVGACAERALPILRRTGELGEFGAVSGEDRPLLGPGFRPALTNWESLCHPTRSSFQTLATSSQGGASLPGAALCRYPSKVRAVCVNRARTDPCGGCEATRIPTATSVCVVCYPGPSAREIS